MTPKANGVINIYENEVSNKSRGQNGSGAWSPARLHTYMRH